jgi:hypothetical protein
MLGIGHLPKEAAIGILSVALVAACSVFDDEVPSGNTNKLATSEEPATSKGTQGNGNADAGGRSDTFFKDGGEPSGDVNTGGVSDSSKTGAVKGCGDGIVTPPEKCDINIPAGNIGACPRNDNDCPPKEPCKKWVYNGELACNADCEVWVPPCGVADDCCPSNCNQNLDPDCSPDCGNGIVEKELGETCEKATSERAQNSSTACPTGCTDDDNDPCTKMELVGSADNCNAACKKVTITKPENGDKCCPEGASSLNDSDCKPICGNGIWEKGEECDGDGGCDNSCKLTLSEEQLKCIKTYGDTGSEVSDACNACMCGNCPSQVVACYGSDDPEKNAGCIKVVDCGFKTGCLGSVCYCGNASGYAIGMCAIPYAADGACKATIEEVAGTTNPFLIFPQQTDPNTALGRAQAISDCSTQKCVGVCK